MVPALLYGLDFMLAAIAYLILQWSIIKTQGKNSLLKRSLGRDCKGIFSLVSYTLGVLLTFYNHYISYMLYVLVAMLWLVPDTRIEKVMNELDH